MIRVRLFTDDVIELYAAAAAIGKTLVVTSTSKLRPRRSGDGASLYLRTELPTAGVPTYSGPVTVVDAFGGEQIHDIELTVGADPRTPTIDTWHGRMRNGQDPRWIALNNFTLQLRFPDGREGTALVDRHGALLGVGYPPFGD